MEIKPSEAEERFIDAVWGSNYCELVSRHVLLLRLMELTRSPISHRTVAELEEELNRLRRDYGNDPTDEEVEEFIKEFDAGLHPLSPEDEAALKDAKARFPSALKQVIARMDAESALAKMQEELTRLKSMPTDQLLNVDAICNQRDELQRELDSTKAELERAREQLNDLRSFVRRITLELQNHRDWKTSHGDLLFQDAYRLYTQYDLEGLVSRQPKGQST